MRNEKVNCKFCKFNINSKCTKKINEKGLEIEFQIFKNCLYCGYFQIISENLCQSCKNLDEKNNCETQFNYLGTIYFKSNPNEKECEKFERKH
jgi:hypothetical protein